VPALQARVRVQATREPAVLLPVSSLCVGSFPGAEGIGGISLMQGRQEWMGEGRWTSTLLRPTMVPDLGLGPSTHVGR